MATARPPQHSNGQRRRILRIGVILGGKIVEERLMRDRSKDITLGQSAKNTFSVPLEGLPRSWTLFQATDGGYAMRLSEGMDGRISDGQGVWTVDQLKAQVARKTDQGWLVPINEGSRGKIVLGDMTLLFQFVTEPPVQPKPHLPASVRGTLSDRIDPHLATILAISILLHSFTAIYFLWFRDPVVKTRAEKVYQRTFDQPVAVQRDIFNQPVVPTKEDDGPAEPAEEPAEAPKEEPKQQQPKQSSGGDKQVSAEERARREEQARLRARDEYAQILKTLKSGKTSDSGVGGGDPDVISERVDDHLKNLKEKGGKISMDGDDKRGTLKGGGADIGEKVGNDRTGTTDITREPQREVKKAKIDVGSATGDTATTLTPADVTKRIRSMYMTGLMRCHQLALKSDPRAGGRVALKFTVTASGRVAGPSVSGFSSEVDACIQSQMNSWRFPPPKDEDGDTFDARYQVTLALQPPT